MSPAFEGFIHAPRSRSTARIPMTVHSPTEADARAIFLPPSPIPIPHPAHLHVQRLKQ